MFRPFWIVARAAAMALSVMVAPITSMAQQALSFITLPTTYWLNAGSGTVTITSTASITVEYVASNTPPTPGTANTAISLSAGVPYNLTSATLIWIQGAVAGTQVSVSATKPGGLTPSAVQGPVTNGWTPGQLYYLTASPVAIKNGPGQLTNLSCFNYDLVPEYVQVFDALADNVTLGTTVPSYILTVAASASGNFSNSPGIQFHNGISVAATTTTTGSQPPAYAFTCSYGFN